MQLFNTFCIQFIQYIWSIWCIMTGVSEYKLQKCLAGALCSLVVRSYWVLTAGYDHKYSTRSWGVFHPQSEMLTTDQPTTSETTNSGLEVLITVGGLRQSCDYVLLAGLSALELNGITVRAIKRVICLHHCLWNTTYNPQNNWKYRFCGAARGSSAIKSDLLSQRFCSIALPREYSYNKNTELIL